MERARGPGRARGWNWGAAVVIGLSAVAFGCGESSPGDTTDNTTDATPTAPAEFGAGFERFDGLVDAGRWRGAGGDVVEVWVCHVPADSTAPAYGGLPLRLDLSADELVDAVQPVADYFDTLSNGAYRPTFIAGGSVDLALGDGPSACTEATLDASTDGASVVLAVADAEHAADQPGGQGSGGDPCPADPPCPASQSRRVAYVGAADFHPDWGDAAPLDLVAHELAHTLGLVHSAFDPSLDQPYQSDLDVMSNSAAARAAQPERRDAPGTLAVQRLIAGWLSLGAATTVPPAGGEVTLVRSDAADGARVLMLPVDDTAFVAVEVIVADGLQAHLPQSGVAVHLVDTSTGAVMVSPTAFMAPGDLLVVGDSVVAHGWRLSVADEWRITVEPAGA